MARRTKMDALATRHRLLDAAEQLFQSGGVSRTSLNDIAQAAGTTRGAIYWHFKDKADLFNAMMERVTLPLEASLAHANDDDVTDPIAELRKAMRGALAKTATDEQTRRVFEIATHKVEYIEELQAVRMRHLAVRNECVAQTTEAIRLAVRQLKIKLPISVPTAAIGLHVMVDGLIQNWLLDPGAFDLQRVGRQTLDAYLTGLGLLAPDT